MLAKHPCGRHYVLRLLALGLLVLSATTGGCRIVYPGQSPHGPKPCIPAETPRELAKVTLPDYIIEPPDILQIDAINLAPKPPYELRVFDILSITSSGTSEVLADGSRTPEVLDGQFTIQPDGSIQLGQSLGAVQAAGLTSPAVAGGDPATAEGRLCGAECLGDATPNR